MKLRKNPLGDYVGKIGNTVGGKWKGIYWVRAFVYPTQRGTIDLWRLLHQGLILPDRFSYKQMNLRRLSLQVLGFIGSQNMANFITPIWEKICKEKKLKMHGLDLFVKSNVNRLYNSMTDIEAEFEETTNSPDLKTILISDGVLESTPITVGTYATGTGIINVEWSKNCYTNGQATDIPYVAILKKPILESYEYPDGNWQPSLFMYPPERPIAAGPHPATRDDEGGHISIPAGLTPADLTLFLFFRNSVTPLDTIRSDSTSHIVVAP